MGPTSPDSSGRLAFWLPLAALASVAAVWALQPIVHDDVFWHVRAGEWIVAHRAVPLHDDFSFTRRGARWITHEWGFSALAAGAHRAGGPAGLLALTAILALAIGWAVWRRCPRSGPAARACSLACLGLGLFTVPRLLFLRPALVGELLLALVLLAADRYRVSGRRVFLAVLVLLFWLWANVHSGVIFGIFLLGLQALEQLLAGRWRVPPSGRPRFEFPAAALAASAVCLVNPNRLDALRFPFLLNRIFFHSGIAWDLGQFQAHSPLANLPLVLLAAAGLAGLVRARPEDRPRPWELVAVVVFFALSLRAGRFVFTLAILLVPAVSRMWAGIAASAAPARVRRLGAAAAALLVVVAGIAIAKAPVRWPPRTLDRSLPAGAAGFLSHQRLRGRMFHHANHGGYLYYALGQPIFWDGRNDVFWTLTREVTTTDFRVVARRYDVDTLVLTEREYADLREVAESAEWALVYWDDATAVYLRRDRFPEAVARLGLTHFSGFGGGTDELRALAAAPDRSQAARAELRSLLAAWPENQRALYFLGVLSHYAGDRAAAVEALRRAIDLGPSELLERTLAVVEAVPPR